ncbi:hypothetical protein QET93_011475 [Akkermansia sp. N21116]|jgi:hypothetical protein|uniref:hypothetical protein n=1 Tax=Akkermansia sp. N21116 TaxID=3040764 RepID=UPI00206316A4|nr:hypothetical protein [Akkermansia sp. N21116]WPX40153.1 hypothetical protein QET93_011475 [Akkermansia sp. N21116]DAU76274.1 MAG TPA: Stage 0 sporulation protein J, Chromosome segregation, Chromosome organization [Caudoviricetes sp.]
MEHSKQIAVNRLYLDVRNPRIPYEKNMHENKLIDTLIADDPKDFLETMQRIQREGYIPSKPIVALKVGRRFKVMDGNRRTAIMKLLLGYVDVKKLKNISPSIRETIQKTSEIWKDKNKKIPLCEASSEKDIQAIAFIQMEHVKNAPGSGKDWGILMRHRYDNPNSPYIVLIDNFLNYCKQKISVELFHKWTTDYPLTLLQETLKRGQLESVLNLNIDELSKLYPHNLDVDLVDNITKLLMKLGKADDKDYLTYSDVRDGSFPGKLTTEYHLYPVEDVDKQERLSKMNFEQQIRNSSENQNPSSPSTDQTSPRKSNNKKINLIPECIDNIKKSCCKSECYKSIRCIEELSKITKKNSFLPNASAFLLRCILEYAVKHAIRTMGLELYPLGKLKNYCRELYRRDFFKKQFPQTHEFLNRVANTENSGSARDQLNNFVHCDSWQPSQEDITTLIENITPHLVTLFESVTPQAQAPSTESPASSPCSQE